MLNSQEIFGDELAMFAKKELQKEVGRFISLFCLSKLKIEVGYLSRINVLPIFVFVT